MLLSLQHPTSQKRMNGRGNGKWEKIRLILVGENSLGYVLFPISLLSIHEEMCLAGVRTGSAVFTSLSPASIEHLLPFRTYMKEFFFVKQLDLMVSSFHQVHFSYIMPVNPYFRLNVTSSSKIKQKIKVLFFLEICVFRGRDCGS